MNAFAHVIVTEGLVDEAFVAERCETEEYRRWAAFVAEPRNSPEALADAIGVPAETLRAAARLYATARNAAIYYGLGVTEHSQGSTMVMAMANLAMATGNIGRPGVGVNPLRGQNNVQGSCDMGSFPHELPGYRHVSDAAVRAAFEAEWGVPIDPEPGLRLPNMLAAALDGSFRGIFIQGEDIAQSDPDTQHVQAALQAMDLVVVQDLFLNETAAFAHVFLPGTSFLEKDGTFTNAERRINRVRPVMPPLTGLSEWETVCRLATAMGYPMSYDGPAAIMDEIARLTPSFAGVSHARLDAEGSMQWPVNDAHPNGTPVMHVDGFVRGKGRFMLTEFVPDRGTHHAPLPADPDHRPDPQPVQCRRPDPAHRQQPVAPRGHAGDPPLRCRTARHRHRRCRRADEPQGRDHPARPGDRSRAPGRGLYHLPPSRDRRQCRDDRVFGLGNQLPGIQGDPPSRSAPPTGRWAGARPTPRCTRPITGSGRRNDRTAPADRADAAPRQPGAGADRRPPRDVAAGRGGAGGLSPQRQLLRGDAGKPGRFWRISPSVSP
ncbi:MAG: hypothetical protein KatS3mg118_0197 [Paracoccaceae bacterium]|nr:MAG: hypothetical protein KatS3mg118_0197 [Paracoccaceae bacterium]